MPYASDNNALLIDDCNNLKDLTITLEVTEDLGTTNNGGWSMQLNCYAPPGTYCQTSQINWLQYIVIVGGGILQYYIQYWAVGTSSWPTGYNPVAGTSPWLPCWAHDYGIAPTFATGLSGDTLPRESTLGIALATNSDGGVTSATFTYTDPDDNVQKQTWKAPAVHPINACELNFVGPPGGSANFTTGLLNSRGIIYYSVGSGQQLSVQSGGVGSACGEAGVITAETSNMTYSDISDAPGSTVTQILQQPVPCVIDSIAITNQARLGEMKHLRDSTIAKHAAGQWLIETLDRHSADLWVILSADEELARNTGELLTKAARMARQESVFDDATIDEGLRVLGHISCKMPRSMTGAGAAGATVLRSLRGKTLEEGLREASKTIKPRFVARKR